MLYYTIMYHTILYPTIIYSTILCYTILYPVPRCPSLPAPPPSTPSTIYTHQPSLSRKDEGVEQKVTMNTVSSRMEYVE